MCEKMTQRWVNGQLKKITKKKITAFIIYVQTLDHKMFVQIKKKKEENNLKVCLYRMNI